MTNQRVGAPFGDVYFIDTPHIDRFSQQMYAEQKQREAMRRQRAEAMDNEFAKNVANIRDADIDEVTGKYGEWKLMNQQLLKKKGGVTPQDQLQLLRLKAEVGKAINTSMRTKQEEEDLAKQMVQKPEDFEDNAYELLTTRRKMPYTQIGEYKVQTPEGQEQIYNLADFNTYKYKGTDFNFQDAEKKAAGDLKDILGQEALEKDGFTFKTPVYQFGSTPSQYKTSLLGALAQRKAGDSAARLWKKITPEMQEQVNKMYDAIPQEKLQRMGLNKLEDVSAKNPDNAAEQYASHMAKLYAINAEPKEGKPVTRRNEQAYIDAQAKKEKEMADYRHRLAVALKKTPGAKAEGSEDDSLYLEDWFDGQIENATSNESAKEKSLYGDKDELSGDEYRMEVNPLVAKAFTKQGLEPEYFRVKNNGQVTPMYFYVDKEGKKHFDKKISTPMTRADALLTIGVKATTGKQRYKEGKSAVDSNKKKTYKGLDKNGNPIFE